MSSLKKYHPLEKYVWSAALTKYFTRSSSFLLYIIFASRYGLWE